MERPQATMEQIDAIHHYLTLEFPGYVQRTWGDTEVMAQVFEVTNRQVLRRIVIDHGFFRNCPNCTAVLRDSDLVDYMRESRSPRRCFCVTWNESAMHIRSKPL